MDTRWKLGNRKLTEAERRFALALIPVRMRAVNREGEQVRGTVVAANERGFQLQGEEKWRNWSKFAEEPRILPAPGHRVRVEIDGQGFVRGVNIIGGSQRTDVEKAQPETMQRVGPSDNNTVRTVTSKGLFVALQPAMHADREFRLKCLNFVVQHAGWFGVDNGEFDTVAGVASEVQAWAEGRK